MLRFFFQAEDGIRYPLVTGVQTCALPIFAMLLFAALMVTTMKITMSAAKSSIARRAKSRTNQRHAAAKIGRASCRERVKLKAMAAAGERESESVAGRAGTE